MDILLSEFVSTHLDELNESEYQNFESLLNEADLDIMNWIMGRTEPDNHNYTPIIKLLRTIRNKPDN